MKATTTLSKWARRFIIVKKAKKEAEVEYNELRAKILDAMGKESVLTGKDFTLTKTIKCNRDKIEVAIEHEALLIKAGIPFERKVAKPYAELGGGL